MTSKSDWPGTEARRVLLVAGEASGDLHGADLVRELRQMVPGLQVRGIGGENLRRAGMQTIVDCASMATMGLVETLGQLRRLGAAYRKMRRCLRDEPPDLVLLIDFPEFNLALAGAARKFGIPVLYFVSPQVWAWRRGRVRKIARRASRLAVVFPFEVACYDGTGAKVDFVGHPLIDRARPTRPREETLRLHGLDPGRETVVLMPGSRPKELALLLPPLLEAARRLAAERRCQFALCLAPTFAAEAVAARLERAGVDIALVCGDNYNVLAASEIALVASGTAALEAALIGTPMVIVYRLSWVTYLLARLLVRVPFIGMPNIIAGEKVVPELVQRGATGARIAGEALSILGDEKRKRSIEASLARVREKLGEGGAARRAAAIAAQMLSEGAKR